MAFLAPCAIRRCVCSKEPQRAASCSTDPRDAARRTLREPSPARWGLLRPEHPPSPTSSTNYIGNSGESPLPLRTAPRPRVVLFLGRIDAIRTEAQPVDHLRMAGRHQPAALDGIGTNEGLILAATNVPWDVDPGVTQARSLRPVRCGAAPDEPARRDPPSPPAVTSVEDRRRSWRARPPVSRARTWHFPGGRQRRRVRDDGLPEDRQRPHGHHAGLQERP